MIGGKVINAIKLVGSTWIQVQDGYGDTCAVRVVGEHDLDIDDSVWWQGAWAYWTRQPHVAGQPTDFKLERIGCSHGGIPLDVMESALRSSGAGE